MKSYFYVIGCNSLQLSADGIQVMRESGVVSIAWPDVKAATLGGEDPSQGHRFMAMVMADQSPSEWASAFRDMMRIGREAPETLWHTASGMSPQKYDVLLIAHRDGIILVYIEPTGPERDRLLTSLRTRLGPMWLGEGVSSRIEQPQEKPVERIDKKKLGCPLGCLAVLAGGLFYGSLFVFGGLSILRTVIRKTSDVFAAGGWKPALLLGTVFSLVALIYWVRKNSAE